MKKLIAISIILSISSCAQKPNSGKDIIVMAKSVISNVSQIGSGNSLVYGTGSECKDMQSSCDGQFSTWYDDDDIRQCLCHIK